MKYFLVLLPIILTTGCSSNHHGTQCDPAKNYIISNPELMEKYKEEFKNGEVKSIYYDKTTIGSEISVVCNNSSCVQYNNKKFNYIEKKINDKFRDGIYTIYNHPKSDKRCNFWAKGWDEVCYESVKNENNIIKSKYGLIMYKKGNATISEFKNIKTNELLFKYSKTIYMTGSIGGPGFGVCNPTHNNNYKFNAIFFPANPFDTPYKIEINKHNI